MLRLATASVHISERLTSISQTFLVYNMREGCFELVLKRVSGKDDDFFGEEEVGGSPTVIGEMDAEYIVCVNIHRDEATGKWPGSKLRIGLVIDGHDVQYSNRVYLSEKLPKEVDYVTAVFEGFKKNAKDLRAFKFGMPSYIPSGSSSSSSRGQGVAIDCLGKIQAVVYKCARAGKTSVVRNQSRFHELFSYESTGREKKAWLQPSLVTKGGQRIDEETDRFPKELARWKIANDDKPIKTLMVSYHTKTWASLKRKLHDRMVQESATTSASLKQPGGRVAKKRKA